MTDDGMSNSETSFGMFDRLKRKANHLSAEAVQLPDDVVPANDWVGLEDALKALNGSEFLIGMCGEFSRGKSLCLGALLDLAELFPDNPSPNTAVVTLVRYLERDKYPDEEFPDGVRIRVTTSTHPNGKPIRLDEVPLYATQEGQETLAEEVFGIYVELDHPLLKGGHQFVDLPGVGSVNVAHTIATNNFIDRLDAALFVCDATQESLANSEVEFFARVVERTDAIVVVVTKIDMTTAERVEAFVDDARRKLATRIGVALADLIIVPVSSLHKLVSVANNDLDLAELSNFAVLEEAIYRAILARSGAILLDNVIARSRPTLEDASKNLQQRIGTLGKEDSEVARIEAEINAESERLEELDSSKERWLLTARYEITNICETASRKFIRDADQANLTAQRAVNAAAGEIDADAVMSEMIDAVADAAFAAVSQLDRDLVDFNNRQSKTLQLGSALPPIKVNSQFDRHYRSFSSNGVRTVTRGETAMEATKRGAGKVVLAAAGAAAGFFFLGPAIFLVGGAMAVGATSGAVYDTWSNWDSSKEKLQADLVNSYKSDLTRHLTETYSLNREAAEAKLEGTIKYVEEMTALELKEALDSRRKMIEKAKASLEIDRNSTEEQAERRLTYATAHLSKVDDIQAKFDSFGAEVQRSADLLSSLRRAGNPTQGDPDATTQDPANRTQDDADASRAEPLDPNKFD